MNEQEKKLTALNILHIINGSIRHKSNIHSIGFNEDILEECEKLHWNCNDIIQWILNHINRTNGNFNN